MPLMARAYAARTDAPLLSYFRFPKKSVLHEIYVSGAIFMAVDETPTYFRYAMRAVIL